MFFILDHHLPLVRDALLNFIIFGLLGHFYSDPPATSKVKTPKTNLPTSLFPSSMNLPEQIQKHKAYTALISLSLFLTALDLYTTYILHGRGYIEGNPFMRPILTEFGPTLFLLINTILSLLLIAFLTYASAKKLEGRYQHLPLTVYCFLRGAASLNNLLILANML